MKRLMIGVLLAICGCESVPSGRWVQPERTEAQTKADYDHCEKVAMQEGGGMRSTDVFKEEQVRNNCMQRLGNRYEKNK
jgi:hypothetical protein